MDKDELYHYGVLGMKWGVRKRQRSPESERLKQIKKKKVKELTNKEIQDANTRIQLERQYKQLNSKTAKGKKAVKAFIAVAGTMAAAEKAYSTYKKYGNRIVDKIGDYVVKDIKF